MFRNGFWGTLGASSCLLEITGGKNDFRQYISSSWLNVISILSRYGTQSLCLVFKKKTMIKISHNVVQYVNPDTASLYLEPKHTFDFTVSQQSCHPIPHLL